MRGSKDKAEAGKDKTKGKFQHAWGELTNNQDMKSKGRANKNKSKAKKATGRLKNAWDALRH
jgi:uncharacterized protein YjbJ (UPF0337 family)